MPPHIVKAVDPFERLTIRLTAVALQLASCRRGRHREEIPPSCIDVDTLLENVPFLGLDRAERVLFVRPSRSDAAGVI